MITYKNDQLLNSEKYRYKIKQNYLNLYRLLILKTDLEKQTWMERLPYVVSKKLIKQIKKEFSKISHFDFAIEDLLEVLEQYTLHKYVKKNVGIKILKNQFKMGMLNLVVLRCISLLFEKYFNKSSIDYMLQFTKDIEYFRGCFKNYNQFKPPLTLGKLFSNPTIYLVGLIIGDGTISKEDLQIEIQDGHTNKNYLKYSQKFLEKINKLIKTNFETKSFIHPTSMNSYNLNITCKWFGTFFHNTFGLPKGKKFDIVKVPEIFKLLTSKVQKEKLTLFWRGVFDSDGSVNANISSLQISIASKSKELMDSLEQYLKFQLKILPTRRIDKNVYKINVNVEDYLKFARHIGSYHPLKMKILRKHILKGPTFLRAKNKWQKLSQKEMYKLHNKWENLRTTQTARFP
jgi:hypothetical protein